MRYWKPVFWLLIGVVILLAVLVFIFSQKAGADTNISPSYPDGHIARDNINGEWNFYGSGNIIVRSTRLEGWATSTDAGVLALDCATSPAPKCDDPEVGAWGVCNGPGPKNADGSCSGGDASGILTGFAWNDNYGWVSFNCNQESHNGQNYCGQINHRVEINSVGDFEGYAWNNVVGFISMNCANPGAGCETQNYKVATSWRPEPVVAFLESAIFDTGGTVTLNSIIWQGGKPAGTKVDFQIAASDDSAGPWNFIGPDGTGENYYGLSNCPQFGVGDSLPDTPICVNPKLHKDERYLRYKVRLQSNLLQTETPRIDDIVLNWSP